MKQRGSTTVGRVGGSRLHLPVPIGSTILIVALVLMQMALPAWGAMPGGTPSARAAQESDSGDETLPTAGPVIVVLNPQVGFRAQSVAETADVAPSAVFSSAVSGFAADLDETQIQDLAANPDVAYIMPDLPVYAAAQTPSTGIKRSGIDKYPPAAIDGVDNPTDVDIAILDSGIDSGHPDLNVAGGVNCLGGSPSSSGWGDENGHGTHVAGIAGARDNSIGSVGSAPGARVWAVRVLDQNGNGSYSSVLCG
ncbi:MAG TPA: S8 family serine peptidase, partial [Thermomicrobiales bacterium]|nr:S8 family serine peptidase [Thermomicrobiales bacterium]